MPNFNAVDQNKGGFLTPDGFAKFWGMPLPAQGAAGPGPGGPEGPSRRKMGAAAGGGWPSSQKRAAAGLYFVDAHGQMDHNLTKKQVISVMNAGGVYRTIMTSHQKRSWKDIIAFEGDGNGRIVPAVKIKVRNRRTRVGPVQRHPSRSDVGLPIQPKTSAEVDSLARRENQLVVAHEQRVKTSQIQAFWRGYGQGDGIEASELANVRGEKEAARSAIDAKGC